MTPRPRKASDDQVFAAAARVMSRAAPAQLTLAEIATEAGLTAGALVQRFGSKRGLLVAFTGHAAAATPAMFAGLRDAAASPLAAVRAYADCVAQMGDSPGGLAHHLAYLQLDFTDPDLHRHVRRQARATRAALRALLGESVDAGELAPATDVTALARAVEVTVRGSLMTWAFHQDGGAASWVRHDLDALLALFGAASRTARRPRASRVSRLR